MIINVKGIIIKEYVIGEGDKYITLFTHEIGKIQVRAPKAKKYENGLASGTQLFVYGQFVLAGYKENYKLLSVDIINMFHNIREDLMRLSYATYVAEFLREVTSEGVTNEELLRLTLMTLHKLTLGKMPSRLVRRIFEMRAFKTIGLMPNLEQCIECGTDLVSDPIPRYSFVVSEGGLVCDHCLQSSYFISLSYTTVYVIRYILYTPIEKLFSFKLEEEVLEQLEKVNEAYSQYYLEKSFKSLEFIKSIENID